MEANDAGKDKPIESNVSLGEMLGGSTIITESPVIQTPPVITPPVVTDPNSSITPTIGNEPVVQPIVPEVETFEGLVSNFNSETISDELKETKETLLSTFKATKIDTKGNLLNDANEVILSADKLKNYIDNDILPIDDKGNVINDKGEILQTKAEVDKQNSVIIPIKSALETNFAIKLADNLDFPETEEGIIQLVSEAIKTKTTNAVRTFLDAVPEVKGFYQHLALGGTAETYTSSNVDYKGINIKNLDESAKIQLLAKSFTLQETPNKDNIIDLIKKAGEEELNKATASAILFLDKKQTETNVAKDRELQALNIQEEQETEQYWNDVNKVVKDGKLGRINIPLAEREAFFNYMSKPINTNYESAESVDSAKDSLEFQLLVSYLRYKKGDISKLAESISKEDKVVNLKSKLANLTRRIDNGVPITTSSGNSGKPSGNLSLDGLLG